MEERIQLSSPLGLANSMLKGVLNEDIFNR